MERLWQCLRKSLGKSDDASGRHAIFKQKIDLEATLGAAQAV